MTPVDIVAEALSHAEKVTPDDTTPKSKGTARFVRTDGWKLAEQAVTRGTEDTHIRIDMHDAALAHVAERCAAETKRADALAEHARKIEAVTKDAVKLRLAAEKRAERAEARLALFVGAILDEGYSRQDTDGLRFVLVDGVRSINLREYARMFQAAGEAVPRG